MTPNPRASEHPPGLLFRSSAGERPAPLRQLRPAGVPGHGTPRPGCRGRAPQRPTREPKDGVLAVTSSGRSQQAGRRPSTAPSRTPSRLLPRGRALSGQSLTAEGGLPGSHPCPVLELTVQTTARCFMAEIKAVSQRARTQPGRRHGQTPSEDPVTSLGISNFSSLFSDLTETG